MRLVLGLLLGVLCAGMASAQQPRLALVIGNQDYANVPKLRNAAADAQAMAALLRERGFDVTERLNLDRRNLLRSFEDFRAKVRAGSVVVFYYAGHGVQVDGANYLLPVDIERRSERDAAYDALALNTVMEKLTAQNSRGEHGLNLLILDACRDNPFRFTRGGDGNGLAAKPAAGLMTLYAAGSGQTALDRLGAEDSDPNGVFTRILLRAMRTPGLPVRRMAEQVKMEVARAARGVGQEQVPAFYDEAEGDYVFTPGETPAAAVLPVVPVPPTPAREVRNAIQTLARRNPTAAAREVIIRNESLYPIRFPNMKPSSEGQWREDPHMWGTILEKSRHTIYMDSEDCLWDLRFEVPANGRRIELREFNTCHNGTIVIGSDAVGVPPNSETIELRFR